MSTILDALKRLEKERPRHEAQQVPLSVQGHPAHPHRIRRRRVVWILVALVTIGVAAALVRINGGLPGIMFSRKDAHPDLVAGTPPSESSKRSVATLQQPQEGPRESARMDNPETSRKPAVGGGVHTKASALRQTVPPAYSERLKREHHPAGSTRSRPVTTMQRPERTVVADQAGQTPTSEPTPRASAEAQAPVKPAPYDDAAPLARGTLQLQAISWSDTPGARITVIDGRILREGHSFDGYTVIQIRPDEIILSKAGKRWRLGYSNQ